MQSRDLPNLLTLSRVIVIPLMIGAFYLRWHAVAATLFLLASVTDYFDGYLARAWQAQSNFGRFLDPIADKLLVASSILVLVHADRADILPSLAILCREILVSGLREYLAELRVGMPVSRLAKWKTAVQMAAIFLLLLAPTLATDGWLEIAGRGLLWIAAALTVVTGYHYLRSAMAHMR